MIWIDSRDFEDERELQPMTQLMLYDKYINDLYIDGKRVRGIGRGSSGVDVGFD